MIAILVDDEPLILRMLKKAVEHSADIDTALDFTYENEALEYARTHPFDTAFLDIELHGTDGITMAKELRRINPRCGIVFCTGYAQYAVDAIESHTADGYLIKPVSTEDVQREIDYIKEKRASAEKLLTVRTGNGFSAYDREGRLLAFNRKKALQLLAVLVERDGEVAQTDELCDALWGHNEAMARKNRDYLWKLTGELRNVLEKCGAGEVLIKANGGYAVDIARIERR